MKNDSGTVGHCSCPFDRNTHFPIPSRHENIFRNIFLSLSFFVLIADQTQRKYLETPKLVASLTMDVSLTNVNGKMKTFFFLRERERERERDGCV